LKTLPIKKVITFTFIAIATATLCTSCSKSGSSPTPSENSHNLTISSLSQNQGSYQTVVDITGTGFSSTPEQNNVKFNGKNAPVVTATSTKLKILVPLAAGSGTVTITTNSKMATGPLFTYVPVLVATPYAGKGDQYGSTDGNIESAKFDQPTSIAFDKNGNLYVVDSHNHTIRKVTADGMVTTVAGTGAPGTAGQVRLGDLNGITVDPTGNVYFTDDNLIKKLSADGIVTTLAGNSSNNYQDGTGVSAGFNKPLGMTSDASGNLYVVESDHRIRKVTPAGIVTTFAGNGLNNLVNGIGINAGIGNPTDITIDKTGNLFIIDTDSGTIRKISADATVSSYTDALTHDPISYRYQNIAVDGSENIFLTDVANRLIKIVKPDKTVATYAGTANFTYTIIYGPVLSILLEDPRGLAIDAANNVYYSEPFNIKKISVQ
jgi:sugar lactone lactonase YvrE